jgi:hypothetical protein
MDSHEELARLRGKAYIRPAEDAPLPATINMAEVQLMIDMAVGQARKKMAQEFEQRLAESKPERSLIKMIFDLQGKVERLNDLLSSDVNPCQEIPNPASITKLRAQTFYNTGKGVPTRQLKIVVWECEKSKITRHKEGTCGNFYMPMQTPGRMARKRFGDTLDYLDADDAKLLGCLLDKKYGSHKSPNQAAIIMPDDHLYLQLGNERLDCGVMKPITDRKRGAPKGEWFWPDTR